MANKIKVTLQVDDNGSLSIVQKNAERAAASTEKLNKRKNTYNRQEKGVAGLTSNSTKAFAKQAQTIGGGGGLVPAYATLAANVFAITAAFGVLQRSAAVKQLEEGLIFTGRAAGQNLPVVVEGLKSITGAAVSTAQAMRAVALGTSAGFSQSQMEGLAKVAKGASLALGRDMGDALDRLTRGAAKLEPEILDELGIMVRLDDATEKYAASLGKTAGELSQFERRMAFTNAIIDQGNKKFAALAAVVDPNPYDKLAASFDNLTKTVLNGLNTAFGPIVGFIADNLGVLIGLLGIFATGVARQMVPALTAGGTEMAKLATETADAAKAQLKGLKSFKGAPKIFDALAEKVANGTATMEEHQQLVTSLDKSQQGHARTLDSMIEKHGEESKQMKDKRAKMAGLTAAQKQLEEVTKTNAAATRQNTQANALNAASQGNIKEMLISLRAAWAIDIAATNADTASKGILTRALAFLTTGFKLATFSIKAFTIALINAIPVIGQIIMVASLAHSFLKDMFSTPPTALEEALEAQKEQLDEFPKVLNQMVAAFAATETAADGFMAALKPTSGILQQVTDMTATLIQVQENEKIEAQVKARMDLIDATLKLKAAQDAAAASSERAMDVINEDTSGMPLWKQFIMAASMGERVQGALFAAKVEADNAETSMDGLLDAQKAYNAALADMDNLDGTKTLRGMQEILVRGIAQFQVSKNAVAGNAEAMALLDQKIQGVSDILGNLNEGNLRESLEQLQELNNQQQAIVGSADAATESVAKFTALFAKRSQVTGTFAEDLKLMNEAASNMAAGEGFDAIMSQYGEIFKKYGITTGTPTEQKKAFDDLIARVDDLNTRIDKRKETAEQENRLREIYLQTGNQVLAAETALLTTQSNRAILEEQIQMDKDLGKSTTALELQLQGLITEELLKQFKLKETEAARDKRLGGDIMGAASESGTMSGELDKNASLTQGLTTLNAASQSTLENLKKMGPEGEFTAAVIGGAMNVAEAWTVAFDTMAEKGATTSDKIQAGMQAVGATINAISQMQQASAKQKVAAVDKEIAAEKKKDGTSQQSLAKIAQLEKKKEAIERKAFEQKKKMQMAEVVMATGVAIMNSLKMGIPFGLVFGAMAAAMGAAQLSAISSQTFDGGSSSIGTGGPSSIGIGQRGSSIDLAKSQGGAGELAYLRGAQGLGGAENFRATNAFTGAKYRASGGNTAYMVGEQGPELFVPDRPGRIESADDTAVMGSPMNVNFSINAVDASGIEDLLVGQRVNIIGMLRDAANSTGDLFMEQVDTGQYTPSSTGAKRY